jgi:hypothetical protein
MVVALMLSATAPAAARSPLTSGDLAPDTFVTAWDATGSQAFTAAGLTPAEGHTIFAYVAIAVYDSVMAIHQDYEPFAVDADAPDGASAEAAVAAAAHAVLVHYLPAQKLTILDPALIASLGSVPDGQAESDGVAVGEDVAAALIAMRADDGFRDAVTYTPPDPPIPGVWIPTAPSPPIGPYLGLMRPFALDSADQFRPGGPPDLQSNEWARDYNEVKAYGSSASTVRTAEQTVAARFWAEPPVQQARNSFRGFVLGHDLDVVQAARFMAMVSVVSVSSKNACFDAKYHFAFWRPITAIRAGDTDGNDATVGDPTWESHQNTPAVSDYPSTQSIFSAAAAVVLANFLGTDQVAFTITSGPPYANIKRSFTSFSQAARESADSRVYAGIHFRSACEDGLALGRKIGQRVAMSYLQPLRPA